MGAGPHADDMANAGVLEKKNRGMSDIPKFDSVGAGVDWGCCAGARVARVQEPCGWRSECGDGVIG